LPVRFEKNEGQFAPQILYQARAGGSALALSTGVAVLQLSEPQATIAFRVVGARDVAARAIGPLAGRTHYLLGNDPSRWQRDVPSFSRISFDQVLKGIDLAYHGDRGALEYDFTVAPGADPAAIALDVQGATDLAVDDRGALRIETGKGVVIEPPPTVYQSRDGHRTEVPGSFRLTARSRVGFAVASYDRSLPLVIDPVLVYSTGIGRTQNANGVAVDAAGNAYVTGGCPPDWLPSTASSTPGTTTDAPSYVAKLDPSGQLVYATYIGGNGNTLSEGIAVDAEGNAYTTGWTQASNLSTSSTLPCPGWDSAFVVKLDPAGQNVVYGACLGGSNDSYGWAIAVDRAGHAYVTGDTDSSNFPTKNSLFPYTGNEFNGETTAFVVELSTSGSDLVYGTFLGQSEGVPSGCGSPCCTVSTGARGTGIAVDSAGDAFVTGYVMGPGFPLKNPIDGDFPIWNGLAAVYPDGSVDAGPAQCVLAADAATAGVPFEKAFVTEIASGGGSLVYSTYLGGNGTVSRGNGGVTQGVGIALDGVGNAFVTGITDTGDFPVTVSPQLQLDAGPFNDTFVAEIAAGGGAIVYSTVLGGPGAKAIAVDDAGTAYVTGSTSSATFNGMAFVAALAPGGASFVYSTYLGANGSSANAVAVDPAGNVIVAGSTSYDGGPPLTMVAKLAPGDVLPVPADASPLDVSPADAPGPETSGPDVASANSDAAPEEGAAEGAVSAPEYGAPSPGALRPDASPEFSVRGGGCSCNGAGMPSSDGAWAVGVALAAWVRRRRSQREARRRCREVNY
jgi:MYXO-CTERM domain-containing protein